MSSNTEIPADKALFLKGPEWKNFQCVWNPVNNLLASGSANSITQIWDLNDNGLENNQKSPVAEIFSNSNVTNFQWNCDGTELAVGSISGTIHLWNAPEKIQRKLWTFSTPTTRLRWNKRISHILAVVVDNRVIILNINSGTCIQEVAFHVDRVLDIDWQTDTIFASCSADKNIHVCKIGITGPELLKTFKGHTQEIIAIQWHSDQNYLASCSADNTIKIWFMERDDPIRTLEGHSKLINGIAWSRATRNLDSKFIISSWSFDSTVKIWEVRDAECIHNLNNHTDAVCSVDLTPGGVLLASSSFDKWIHIWAIERGQLMRSYKSFGIVYSLSWNHKGDKLGAVVDDGSVFVLDLRKL